MKPVANCVQFKKDIEKLLTDKIHYGCGKKIFNGWLNVDNFDESYPDGYIDPDLAKNIFYCDLVKKHPFPSDYFAFGFCEDFLEHLDQADSLIFLGEVYRTFLLGGVIRLSFPSLEGVLRRHFNKVGFEWFEMGKRDAYSRWSHKNFYCRESITLVAKHIGFRKIEFVNYGISKYPVLNKLDSRYEQQDLNLYVELTK